MQQSVAEKSKLVKSSGLAYFNKGRNSLSAASSTSNILNFEKGTNQRNAGRLCSKQGKAVKTSYFERTINFKLNLGFEKISVLMVFCETMNQSVSL